MRRVVVMAVLCMAAGTSFAWAQTKEFTGSLLNGGRTGPCVVTEVREVAVGGGVGLVTRTKTIGGGSAHFDITVDEATGAPLSFDIYGYTTAEGESSPTVKHIVACSSDQFVDASSYPAKGYPHTEKLNGVLLCSFNPDGVDGATDGLAYLHLKGYSKKLSEVPADVGKYVLSGTLGGGLNRDDDNFVFKGSLGTVARPKAD